MFLKYGEKEMVPVTELNYEVKDLTLDDLYNLYERQKLVSLVKIINGDIKLFLDKEE